MANILIIEDDPLILRLYQQAFTFNKHVVQTAADGEEGWKEAQEHVPDVILLDIMLPKMNGLDLLDKLKNDPGTKKIPVIMLTNLADEHDAMVAIDKGAIKYLVKSNYKPKQIVAQVEEVITAATRNKVPKTASE